MTKSETTAKIIRIITAPPILVTALFIVLFCNKRTFFQSSEELLLAILLLGIVPALAYPLQALIPAFKEAGRKGQRKLAFILSVIGYTAALICGYVLHSGIQLLLIFWTYFLSVICLSLCNLFLHVRASGHSCSITGPLVFLVYFLGVYALIPCILIAAGTVWSSLKLKRHTPKDLLSGAIVCILAFAISLAIMYF